MKKSVKTEESIENRRIKNAQNGGKDQPDKKKKERRKKEKEKPATRLLLTFLDRYSKGVLTGCFFVLGLIAITFVYGFLFGKVTERELRMMSEYANIDKTLEQVGVLEKPDNTLREVVTSVAATLPYATPSAVFSRTWDAVWGNVPEEIDVSGVDTQKAKQLPAEDIEKDYFYNRRKQLQHGSMVPSRVVNMLNGKDKSGFFFSRGYSNQDLSWVLE